MKQENNWWKPTANHVWRTYFSILCAQDANPDKLIPMSHADRTAYNICDTVCRNLPVPSDIHILRMYYTTPRGQELHNIEDFSLKNNVPIHIIWKAVRHANRAVMEELGLIDRKQNTQDASE